VEKVLEQLYSGMVFLPPIFLVAHGLGALITLKFLILNEPDKGLTNRIKGIGFFNPFFQWNDADEMESKTKFFKMFGEVNYDHAPE